MIYDGIKFRAVISNQGFATITRKQDGASVYLQGADTIELESQMDAVDATAENGYPIGPFKSYAEHLDVILDQYETVMQ